MRGRRRRPRGRRSVAYGTERIRGGFHRIPASRVALMIDPIYPVPERFGKIKPTIVVPRLPPPPGLLSFSLSSGVLRSFRIYSRASGSNSPHLVCHCQDSWAIR